MTVGLGEDVIGGLGPGERFAALVVGVDEDADRAGPELRIELSSRSSHDPLSLKVWPPRYGGNRRLVGDGNYGGRW